MTGRQVAWWACHWAATLLVALAATGPFTGPYAPAAGLFAATAVGLIGYATAPHPGAHT